MDYLKLLTFAATVCEMSNMVEASGKLNFGDVETEYLMYIGTVTHTESIWSSEANVHGHLGEPLWVSVNINYSGRTSLASRALNNRPNSLAPDDDLVNMPYLHIIMINDDGDVMYNSRDILENIELLKAFL